MKKYQLLIFDMDGTLVDTSEGIYNCHKYANRMMGRKAPSDEELSGIIGGPLLNTYLQRFGYEERDARKAVEYYRERYAEKGITEVQLYEGIRDTLKELKKKGILLAVATLKAEKFAKQILVNLNINEYFDFVSGMDEKDTRSKSDLVTMCLNELHVSQGETALVGDSLHDGLGAHQSGVDFIAVTYGFGYQTKKEAIDDGACYALKRITELLQLYKED